MSTPSARLVWEKGDGSQVEFPLTAEIHLVGREEPADIQVSEPLVSRSHARLDRLEHSSQVVPALLGQPDIGVQRLAIQPERFPGKPGWVKGWPSRRRVSPKHR